MRLWLDANEAQTEVRLACDERRYSLRFQKEHHSMSLRASDLGFRFDFSSRNGPNRMNNTMKGVSQRKIGYGVKNGCDGGAPPGRCWSDLKSVIGCV